MPHTNLEHNQLQNNTIVCVVWSDNISHFNSGPYWEIDKNLSDMKLHLEKNCSVYSRCYATTARSDDMPGSFLGNGSVNTFPQQGTDAQQ
jgi:hypothetical protein